MANEGLSLAGGQDANWWRPDSEALVGLARAAEALEVARALTALPSATAAQWLTRARLAWTLAGETPTDETRAALDAASRLAPSDPAVAQARQQLLVILKADRFPPRLAELGFVAAKAHWRRLHHAAALHRPGRRVPHGERQTPRQRGVWRRTAITPC